MDKRVTVGVGDLALSDRKGAELVTYSLGSCLGVMIHDPVAAVGGLLHFMLPESTLNPERARRQPGLFADTGLPLLFRGAYSLGARKSRLRVVVVGGSQVIDESGRFNVGARNYAALRKIFWRNNVLIDAEDVGGRVNRTAGLMVGSGHIWVRVNSDEVKKL